MNFFTFLLLFNSITYSTYASERKIRVEWEPMENAEKYTVEVVESKNCVSVPDGDQTRIKKEVSTPFLAFALETGNYCFRVHGVSFEGVAGVWSDYQSLVIPPFAPQAPSEVKSLSELKWEDSGGADFYEVEITSPALKKPIIYRAKDGKFEVPERLQKYLAKKKAPAEVRVSTVSRGIKSPSPTRIAIARVESPSSPSPVEAKVVDSNAFVGLKPGVEPSQVEFPPQPDLIKKDPTVWRSFLLAQKLRPAPVSPEEFKRVRSSAERDALKNRSIASDRLLLDEELKASIPTDFRLGLRFDSGFNFYNSDGSDRDVQYSQGAGIGETLFVDGRSKKRFGYLLEQEYRNFPKLRGDVYSSRWLVLPMVRLPLDSFWESVVSFGLGPEISTFTFQAPNTDNTTLSLFGLSLLTHFFWQASDAWVIEGDGRFRVTPPARVEDADTRAMLMGGGFSLGARYRINSRWSLLGGARVSVQRVEAFLGDPASSGPNVSDPKALWFDLGVYTGVSIEMNPTQPLPNAKRFWVAPQKRFRFEAMVPLGIRSTERNPASSSTEQAWQVPPAFEWRAQVTPSLKKPIFIQNDGRLDTYSSWLSLKLGYQWSVMDRDDFWLSLAGGGALRAHSGLGDETVQFDSAGAELLFALRKQILSSVSLRGEFLLYIPIYLRFGKEGSFGGANTVWRSSLDAIWHFHRFLYLFGGYGFEQLRYFVRERNESTSPIDALSTGEHFFRVGVGLEF